MVHVPALITVRVAPVVPLLVQMMGVLLVKVIGLPDGPPLALRVTVLLGAAARPMGLAGLLVKPVMVWVALLMVRLMVLVRLTVPLVSTARMLMVTMPVVVGVHVVW